MGAGIAGSWLRQRETLAAALVLLAVSGSCSDTGGGDVGQLRPPSVYIGSPRDLELISAGSFEVSGDFSGHVVEVTVSVDRGPPIPALRGDEAGTWRVAAGRIDLRGGYHEIVATAIGDAGQHSDRSRIFVSAPDESPFTIVLQPDRLELDPGQPGLSRGEVTVLAFAPAAARLLELQLLTEVRPDPAAVRARALPARVLTGSSTPIIVDVGAAAPGSSHEVLVRAVADSGQEAVAAFHVVAAGTPPPASTSTTSTPTTATLGPPHTRRYDVASRVTASSTDLPATDARATWDITWRCPTGRCDASVAGGGPRGGVEFGITYDRATESFAFAFVLPQPENQNCPTNEVQGTLIPNEWDEEGPLAFAYTLDSALQCATGAVTVSWAGTGELAR